MNNKQEKLVIIIQESLFISIIKDIVTFAMFGGLMYFNHQVLSGNGWIDAIFIFLVFLYLSSKNLSQVFSGKAQDAIKWLEAHS